MHAHSNDQANNANSSSELSTCNYIARQKGVKKGMFLGDAIIKCPGLVVLPYDFEGFQEVSGIVADQLRLYAEQYNGCVEQVSCDEAYVEINIDPNDCQHNDIYDFVKREMSGIMLYMGGELYYIVKCNNTLLNMATVLCLCLFMVFWLS